MQIGHRRATTASPLCNRVKHLDMYARGVSLTFQGEPKFSTWTGAVLTFLTIVLLTIFTSICTLKLVSREDPFLSANTLPREDNHRVDLIALDYAFAVT